MEFPKTLQEFQSAFPDEETCWETLLRARWPDGFVCPRCGDERGSSWIATRRLEQCRRCRYPCSVTAGTVFHRTRLPLLTWFWAIFPVSRHKQGISALQLQRDTGIGSYGTAWALLHRLRSALRNRADRRRGGLVEVEESYVGGPEPGRRGGREVLNKSIVAVAVEQRATAGRARLALLQGVSLAKDLGPFIATKNRAEVFIAADPSEAGPGRVFALSMTHLFPGCSPPSPPTTGGPGRPRRSRSVPEDRSRRPGETPGRCLQSRGSCSSRTSTGAPQGQERRARLRLGALGYRASCAASPIPKEKRPRRRLLRPRPPRAHARPQRRQPGLRVRGPRIYPIGPRVRPASRAPADPAP